MLSTINKSTNLNATSTINNTVVMYMNATVSTGGETNINQSIKDYTLYKANKTEVDADYEEFKKVVFDNE